MLPYIFGKISNILKFHKIPPKPRKSTALYFASSKSTLTDLVKDSLNIISILYFFSGILGNNDGPD